MATKRLRQKRAFGEISPLPSGRYRARYRGPDGERHTAPVTFQTRYGVLTGSMALVGAWGANPG